MVASGFTTLWMNTILGLIFGAAGSPYTAPSNLYILHHCPWRWLAG